MRHVVVSGKPGEARDAIPDVPLQVANFLMQDVAAEMLAKVTDQRPRTRRDRYDIEHQAEAPRPIEPTIIDRNR
jgi:hypothetical protein